MKTTSTLAVLAAIATLTMTAARAQDSMAPLVRNQNMSTNSNSENTIEKYAISGRKSTLSPYYSAKLNCTPADWQEVTITQEPQHGKARLIEQTLIMQYPTNNPRSSCNGKSIRGKVLEYTPEKDYKGSDQIVVELVNDTGQLLKFDYKITVK